MNGMKIVKIWLRKEIPRNSDYEATLLRPKDESLPYEVWVDVDLNTFAVRLLPYNKCLKLDVTEKVSAKIFRTKSQRGKLMLCAQDPEDLFDVLTELDLQASYQLHREWKESGLKSLS